MGRFDRVSELHGGVLARRVISHQVEEELQKKYNARLAQQREEFLKKEERTVVHTRKTSETEITIVWKDARIKAAVSWS